MRQETLRKMNIIQFYDRHKKTFAANKNLLIVVGKDDLPEIKSGKSPRGKRQTLPRTKIAPDGECSSQRILLAPVWDLHSHPCGEFSRDPLLWFENARVF